MGGTSGALYSIFFSGLGKALRDQHAEGAKETTPEVWAKASEEALSILYKCTCPPSHTFRYPLFYYPFIFLSLLNLALIGIENSG